MRPLYGIYGASGCGRGVMPLARAQLAREANAVLVFIDDQPPSRHVNGHDVLTFEEFRSRDAAARHVAIAVANPAARQIIAQKCLASGASFFSVCATSSIQMDDVEMGEGALISPFVTFTSNIRIGSHFHANLYSYVEHDCTIGDFVTFAPGVQCNGNVEIGDGAYIGAGAVIRQGQPGRPLRIGRNAVVGMGAVVIRDVPSHVTVVGTPARILEC